MAPMIIITNDIVKPSSPTPLSSKTYKLSFQDQNAAPMYIPLIFFYKNVDESKHEEISRRMKQSLSKTLTIFYPLAGKFVQNSYVDCDDSGVMFVEARVHARLQQLIENPNLEELNQFLPTDSLSHDDDTILSVKASFFTCGGFCVGICMSHKIADAASLTAFMNAWGVTCRGSGIFIPTPLFDTSLHFPPTENISGSNGLFKKEERIRKRLVFARDMLEKIRREASSEEVKDPSRVEAVSAFIWRSFIKAKRLKAKTIETTSFAAGHAVNLRPRAVPPIPGQTFGNCVALASAMIDISSSEDDERWSRTGPLVSRLRTAIRGVGEGYFNNVTIKDGDESDRLFNEIHVELKSENTCIFSSWLGFPVYGVDFGWGKPVWVGTATLQYINVVLLLETSTGDGVEAWLSTPDDDFSRRLEADYNNLLI